MKLKRTNRQHRTSLRRAIPMILGLLLELSPGAQARVCNQSAQPICDQPYDAVSYATTHNSFSVTELGFLAANQHYGLTRQLDEGIRALMLDVYDYADASAGVDPDVYLCHGYCSIGHQRLTDGLQDIKDFLDSHPYEVVSIIFESYVHIDQLVARFSSVGLDPYLHQQTVGQPWPTLNQMIDAGKRLVVFSDRVDAPRPGYHYVWSHAVETPFSAESPGELSCNRNRGSDANPLFILNHFLTRNSGSPFLATQVNFNNFFITRAIECWAARLHLPNFVTVDYYDLGDVNAVVDELNRNRLLSATPPPTYTPTPTPTPFVCGSAPNPGCLTPVRASMKISGTTTKPKLNLKWKGALAAADFGDPTDTTKLGLCVYVDDSLAMQLSIPAGSDWSSAIRNGVTRQHKYRSGDGSPDGIDKVTLKFGESPPGQIAIHADGDNLALPVVITSATATSAVTAQLIVQNAAQCWTGAFSGDIVRLR